MIKLNKNRRSSLCATIFLFSIILSNSLYFGNLSYGNLETVNFEEASIDNLLDLDLPPNIAEGDGIWWNGSFQFRNSLNVSNPFGKNVDDAMALVSFNYSTYVNNSKMNDTLKDVRIVQNGQIKNYLIVLDYPETTLATIYFEVDLVLGEDTSESLYMYYGNDTIERASEYYNAENRFGNYWCPLDVDDQDNDDFTDILNGGLTVTTETNSPYIYEDTERGNVLSTTGSSAVIYGGFTMGTTVSIAGWVKGGSSAQMPFSYGADTRTYPLNAYQYSGYLINNDGDSANTPFYDLESSDRLNYPTDGLWHHYIWENVDFENGTTVARFWIDGVLRGTANYKNPTATDQEFQLSGWAPPRTGYYWNGYIDDVRVFDYPLTSEDAQIVMNSTFMTTTIGTEEVFAAFIEVNILDVDGRIVPNAEVILLNESSIVETQYTNENGTVRFEGKDVGVYNITVNYTSNNNFEFVAYDSAAENYGTSDSNMFNFTKYINFAEIVVDIWTIDLYIKDYGMVNPMDYGFIEIYDDIGRTGLWDNITINSGDGTALFRGNNISQYYYDIYYKNEDYYQTNTIVAEGVINNTDLVKKNTIEVISDNLYSPTQYWYEVHNIYYVNGSDDVSTGITQLINATIDMTNMEDLTRIDISYIDKDSQIQYLEEYSMSYSSPGTSEETIMVNFLQENIEAYGIEIIVQGDNTTTCNGIIDVLMSQTTSLNIETNISKIDIQVVDDGGIVGGIVKIWDGNIDTGLSIVNLTTSSGEVYGEKGYAYGSINKIPFWYYQGEVYNISLRFGSGDETFLLNYTNPDSFVNNEIMFPAKNYYNFTLDSEMMILMELKSTANYLSNFTEYVGDQNAIWGQNISYTVRFQTTNNYEDEPPIWNDITNAEYVSFSLYLWGSTPQLLYTDEMKYTSNGYYTITVNTSQFSAGFSSKNYVIGISGKATGFPEPTEISDLLIIDARPTDIQLRENSDPIEVISNNTVKQYYNELEKITFSYSYQGQGTLLRDAIFNYEWTYGAGSSIGEDPMNPGYYTFEINTSDSPNIGKYFFNIEIMKENYTIGELSIFLEIISRPTTLTEHYTNQQVSQDLLRINKELGKTDSLNFTYSYNEQLGAQDLINNLSIAEYTWEYTKDGSTGTEQLELLSNGSLNLDFDTANREVGSYILLVTISKLNFDQCLSIIFLTISNRISNLVLGGDFNGDTSINIVAGNSINFEIELTDSATGEPINDATVIIKFDELGREIELVFISDGKYGLSDSFEDVDAFYRDFQISATLIIEIENYDLITRDLSVVIKMEEVFEGFPMFYLLIIIGAVALIGGSLGINKAVHNAKIPAFVKLVNNVESSIQKKKTLKDGNYTESMNEMIIKDYGAMWKLIGCDLSESLGITEGGKDDNLTPGDVEGGDF